MALAYNAIDSDSHILEPLDLWDKYIDPKFRERRPRFVIDQNGKERLSVEGKMLGNPRGIGSLGSIGVRQGAVKLYSLKYAEGKRGGFDPHARIVDMDLDGIDAAFLYPSLGLFAGAVEDSGLAAAMCRAYNRWLADIASPIPTACSGSRCCRCSRSSWRSAVASYGSDSRGLLASMRELGRPVRHLQRAAELTDWSDVVGG